ncbi:hypothetical protein UR09_00490 [Candidatus Nitromaritima sp. SCGC AAA799-A02]|nr:hypothetical protein UR09_00490 [Candidatus Nitromaritima sp. SCGC AAA799-A02]
MNPIAQHIKNERGFSMVEMLIAGSIGVVLLGITILIFTKQETALKQENQNANLRAKGRLALRVLTKELRMAGFGLPPSTGITAPDPLADGTTLSFRSNLNDIRTTTPASGTSGGSSGASAITVVDGSGFSNNDNIVIYYPAFNKLEFNTVSGNPSSTSIPLGSNLANSYVYGASANLVTINKYNNITIALSGTNINKTVDGAATVLISDVASNNGLQFNFYGETETSQLKRVGVTLNMQDALDSSVTMEFKTDINLRN